MLSIIYRKFTLVLFLLFIAVASFSAQDLNDDDEIINIESSIVLLNAAITDSKGNPIQNLIKDEIEIFEDGIRQEIEFFESREIPFAAVILLDTSGSMEMRVSLARSAAIKFLEGIHADDQVAIYNFDSKVKLVQDFSNIRDLRYRAYDLQADGYTALNDAIFEASEILAGRSEKRKAIIVLSDGTDTSSGRSATEALKMAQSADAVIYTVDMSMIKTAGKQRLQNKSILKKFAKETGGIFVETPGGVQLRDAFTNIVEELSKQYTIGYSSTNNKKDGKWREITLKIKDKNLQIRTRKGYNAPKK